MERFKVIWPVIVVVISIFIVIIGIVAGVIEPNALMF